MFVWAMIIVNYLVYNKHPQRRKLGVQDAQWRGDVLGRAGVFRVRDHLPKPKPQPRWRGSRSSCCSPWVETMPAPDRKPPRFLLPSVRQQLGRGMARATGSHAAKLRSAVVVEPVSAGEPGARGSREIWPRQRRRDVRKRRIAPLRWSVWRMAAGMHHHEGARSVRWTRSGGRRYVRRNAGNIDRQCWRHHFKFA